jgi:hypothetical protein
MAAVAGGTAAYLLRSDGITPNTLSVQVVDAPPRSGRGLWISPAELRALPMSGSAWDAVLSVAQGDLGTANVADQDSGHDGKTLACALAAARTGRADLLAKATNALSSAIGTEAGARWLAIGRNLGAYVIAADVLGIRSGPIYDWLASFLVRSLHSDRSDEPLTIEDSWRSGSNASAQVGFVHAALCVYTGNKTRLARGWDGYRRYCGDRTSPHQLTSNSDVWQADPSDPVGIQNKGAVKNGCRLDGAISNDMSRGGDSICNPGYTQYPWVGLQGAVPAALVYARAGYPAWEIADAAIRRALEYLYSLRPQNPDWFDGTRGKECIFLVNRVYGTSLPCTLPIGSGRTFGYTDWTHQADGAALRLS